jgi:tetratricopeptide (TPR) repeat protein
MRNCNAIAICALCWLLLPQFALAASDGETAIDLLDKSQIETASALIAQLDESDPWRPVARAYLQFFEGDYGAARKSLPAAGAFAPGDARLPRLRSRIEQSWRATLGMLDRPMGNFVFRFAPGADALLPEYASEALEAQRSVMEALLDVSPTAVLVEFFPDVDRFVQASGLPKEWVETTHTVAIAKWDRMLVLSPMNKAYGYPWLDTLAHEYVHLALARASAGGAPVWFHEGSAKLLEGRWRGAGSDSDYLGPWAESLLVRALEEGSLVSFAQMHPSMAALPSSEMASLAFAQVSCALDFVFSKVGDAGYRRVVEEIAEGADVLAALGAALGIPSGSFEEHYQRHLRGLPLRKRAQVQSFDLKLEAGAASTTDQDIRGLDPVLFEHQQMQQYVRLGDMLRLRGHREAALVEYRRAELAEPFHSPALANKQARTLRALGRTDEAHVLLEESVSLYPEFTPTTTLLAELAAAKGDAARARALFLHSIALNPFDPAVHRQLATLLNDMSEEQGTAREARVLRILGDWLGP